MTPAGMWVRYLLKKQEPRTLENMQAESAKAQISRGELNQGLGEMWQQGYAREGEGG